ncbi:sensor domain-containing protein [Streptomyces lunaelactis]|uniref:sensor histidine kinase n=1 Tax=Streptomyces lunaelactis TaxID=1535768 RepID=UPI0015857155|nr:sensor domain-containing protein [Streptomyces lunaelactis]NUK91684.1 sensor domain-containing protein [Streptomyces lunaelactis]
MSTSTQHDESAGGRKADAAGGRKGDEAGGAATGEPGVRETVVRAAGAALAAVEQLAGGLSTALMALFVLLWTAVTAVLCLAGVGLLMAPAVLRALHSLAARERDRLGRWGPEVVGPGPAPTRLRLALVDPTTRRELRWLAHHATLGLPLGLFGVLLPLFAIRDSAFPLYWRLMPEGATSTSIGLGIAHSWPDAIAVGLLGLGWIAIIVGLTPGMARLQARPGRRLLAAGPETDLSLRVAQLTASRAAALDAHSAELRRIERSLHDGTQNRLVTVTVLLGAARRMVARDPSGAEELLERAQTAAEQALSELRQVGRGILPPVLADRGLAGALTGLAASCLVPCRIDVEAPERCAASVEATAYFVVAEALTNIAKHSHAENATVTVRSRDGRLHLHITDDGRGGADEDGGSGLTGIRRRIAAHDGTLSLASPAGGPTTLKVELPCGS